MNLIESTAKYETTCFKTGKTLKKRANLLIETDSIADADFKTLEYLGTTEKITTNSKISAIDELILNDQDADSYFEANIIYYDTCEKTGKEKKISKKAIVCCDDIKRCLFLINSANADSLLTYFIKSVKLSKIDDIILKTE